MLGTKLSATSLIGRKCGFRPFRYSPSFVFGDGGEDMYRKAIGVRIIAGGKINSRIHQRGDEGDVAGQTVKLGYDERRTTSFRLGDVPLIVKSLMVSS